MKTKNQIFAILLFCFGISFSQQIIVNDPGDPQSSLNAEDLLNEVLINSNACASATLELLQDNPDGTTTPAQKSWGYFRRGTSNFPFEEGIILSSGYAESAEGPNNATGTSDTGVGWGGDADLKAILDNEYGGNADTNNATVFQFRFTPVTNSISFDFIFASEEYEDEFECDNQYRDGFAFLIRGPGIPDDSGTAFGGTNMASIPGSANIPVNTFSIHRDTFICGGENPGVNYFPNLYVSNWAADNQNEVQYDGMTRVLTAATNALTPGQEYTLKMVISDRTDTSYDSAVFLSSGNFNLGGDLGDDMTIAGGNPACEGETVTLDGSSGAGSTYEWYQDGILLPGEVGPTLNVTVSGTYRLDVTFGGSGACTSSDEVVIEFKPLPLPGSPNNLLECDQAGTGIGDFLLTDNDANIIGAQTDVTLTYHISQADADNNANPLASPYTTTPVTIFYRVDDDLSDCFITGSFDLIAGQLPATIAVTDYESCDDTIDGDDTNGFIQNFQLSTKDIEIINGQTNMVVTYHLNLADANTAANPLVSPYSNITPNSQLIFYRIEDTTNGCYDTGSFNLVVNPLPDVQNTLLEQCDGEDGVLDGLSIYNLAQADPFLILTGTVADYTFTYYLTLTDAINGTNPQAALPFQSTVPNQVIYARVTLNTTGCWRIAEITLGITTTDVPDYPLEVCDDDYDGFAEFDLSLADAIVLGPPLPVGLTVVYYETHEDAQFEINPLPTLYTNIVPNMQTIYTRVEDGNSCFGIGELVLQVNPIPAVTDVTDFMLCSDTAPTAIFDLTSKDGEVLNGQNPADFTVSYYNIETDACQALNPLASPYNGTDGETIWVRIEDNVTGCHVCSVNFDLIVHPNPTIATPVDFTLCDVNNAGDGFEEF
ncbi:MAG: iron-regulated protein FrpC, partial [Flavobacteriaceae bacterium]|nr:iron-regulated protein FrpC [Flavobacteriaceae bacterium]